MTGLDRRRRASLALALNLAAMLLAVSALTTSHWCEGTRKVVKPFCSGSVVGRQSYCISYNSTRGGNDSRMVQYVFETGEDKFVMRTFHSGIWFSCEQNIDLIGEKCRSFINVAPPHERGLLGMVAHMMYTTAFQLTVSLGPEDWKPQTWDYSWSYILAWGSFTACMASSVTTINRYTKTILEFKHKRRNIEKNLKIKQKLLDLDSPDQVWDMYISSVPSTAEELLDLSSSARKLSNNSVFLDLNDMPEPQSEEYC
ncbi:germ cell-specific gene 1-like protein isoform X2 [Astyanax mexicanus]|uniref:germ cell-specific gene 1-like protein isoform X2 n=1 Tax=Astyanax mexicanus TaxID=7994 RepID=UPI000440AFDF|nr:germ cell-specific gene 1-like protein isoform X2 [Astyanax mexicanus]